MWLMGLKVGVSGSSSEFKNTSDRCTSISSGRRRADEGLWPLRPSLPFLLQFEGPRRYPTQRRNLQVGASFVLELRAFPGREADCTSTGLRRFGQLSTSTFAPHPCFHPFHSRSAHFLSGSDSTAFLSNGRHRQPRSKVRWTFSSLWLSKPLNVHLVAADHAQALSTDLYSKLATLARRFEPPRYADVPPELASRPSDLLDLWLVNLC